MDDIERQIIAQVLRATTRRADPVKIHDWGASPRDSRLERYDRVPEIILQALTQAGPKGMSQSQICRLFICNTPTHDTPHMDRAEIRAQALAQLAANGKIRCEIWLGERGGRRKMWFVSNGSSNDALTFRLPQDWAAED
jgi:hypothetical protein